jgi:hypothetical protein
MDETQTRHTRPTESTATCAVGSSCYSPATVLSGLSTASTRPVGAPEGDQNALTLGFYARGDAPARGWGNTCSLEKKRFKHRKQYHPLRSPGARPRSRDARRPVPVVPGREA